MITAKDNPRVKAVAALCASAAKRAETGRFVLEGARLCSELIKENFVIFETYYTAEAYKKSASLIDSLCQNSAAFEEVSDAVFRKMADTKNPQGILCVAALPQKNEQLNGRRYIAFENIADPSNLGAAARTADALGVDGVILSKNGVDPYSPKVLRASMGAVLRLPIIVCDNFLQQMEQMKQNGFQVIGTVVDATATPVTALDFSQKTVLIIGNEANGLTEQIRSVCTKLSTIPMQGNAESFNAAAAAAIVMWEMMR